jgi:phage repressor protein C with HTH and peptisase S24 domain
VSRLIKGERQMKPLETVQIAAFLGVPEEELLRHAVENPAPGAVALRSGRGRPRATASAPSPPVAPTPFARAPDLIPIRSAGREGDQQMVLADGPIGYTPRPANLSGVRNAYAIYMAGDEMEPRYEPGWLLHVNPFKPPTRGRDVIVYKRGNAVLIKQFVGWERDALALRQLNPEETLRIARADVLECHLVVGADQEG